MLAPIIYHEYDGPHVYTAEEDREYKRAQELEASNYFYPVYTFAVGPEAAPTQAVSEPPTPKPLAPRRITPQTPRMSRLAKEAAKFARNTPKAVSIKPSSLPKIVEADQAPIAGIHPCLTPLNPRSGPRSSRRVMSVEQQCPQLPPNRPFPHSRPFLRRRFSSLVPKLLPRTLPVNGRLISLAYPVIDGALIARNSQFRRP